MLALLDDRGEFAAAALVKFYDTVCKGEKGIIAAAADVGSGMDFSSALTGYYSAGFDN